MLYKRIIANVIVRDGWVVQSINFEKFLPVGSPEIIVEFLSRWEIDEIVMLDMSATPKGLSLNPNLVNRVSKKCFVPLTVGGGIRTPEDIQMLIHAGADRVCINSAAIDKPDFIKKSATIYGHQCIVVSIDVININGSRYEVCSHSGKKPTGWDVVDWAQRVEQLGAGEILLKAISRDGSKRGYDLALAEKVVRSVKIPVVICGGVGSMGHFLEGFRADVSAVAAGNIFHFTEHSVINVKRFLQKHGAYVRAESGYDENYFSQIGPSGRITAPRQFNFETLF